MGLKDTLGKRVAASKGRKVGCRVCDLIDQLPAEDAAALRDFMGRRRRTGPKPIADALAEEGYGTDWYHAVKHHLYVCKAAK